MSQSLPSSPMDVFAASLESQETERKAKLFGWWDFPLEVVGVDVPEENATDRAYWHYTSGNPITRTKQEVSEALFANEPSIAKLPPDFQEEASLTFAAAGDLIRAEGLEHSKDILFSGIEDILFAADIAFANYESVVAEDDVVREAIVDGQSFIMCCSTDQYTALTEHRGRRFDILNVANNHSLDVGVERLSATQDLLARDGIMDIGAPREAEEYGKGKILTTNGIKIGLVSATFSLNGEELPSGQEHRVHTAKLMSKLVPTDLSLLRAQVKDCKEQGCDFIVASIHWGVEYEFFPRLRQIEAAHALVEDGVDIIIGTHPHVIQPVEFYRTKRDPKRLAVIAYSLGSLTWGWYTAPHLILSLILNIELVKGQIDGDHRTYIRSVKSTPVFRDIFQDGERWMMRIEMLKLRLRDKEEVSAAIRQMKHYADLVLGESWQASQDCS
ncbi:CapA family protein [Rhizobium leguminosarum]|uniref:CapA family protein n=1 Tax=Rhizobium leguminosarum TaxID=384 RepID=UPI001C911414|nr:CapA family protein [Rhizobium leguminosarum]MBY2967502.1 CapA family protein [Rhizobium leguminosarum]